MDNKLDLIVAQNMLQVELIKTLNDRIDLLNDAMSKQNGVLLNVLSVLQKMTVED